jgi:hypothetical protein
MKAKSKTPTHNLLEGKIKVGFTICLDASGSRVLRYCFTANGEEVPHKIISKLSSKHPDSIPGDRPLLSEDGSHIIVPDQTIREGLLAWKRILEAEGFRDVGIANLTGFDYGRGFTRLYHELEEALLIFPMTKATRLILYAIIRETYGWATDRKIETRDWGRPISEKRIMVLTGYSRSTVTKALRLLKQWNVIEQRGFKILTPTRGRPNRFKVNEKIWEWNWEPKSEREDEDSLPPKVGLTGDATLDEKDASTGDATLERTERDLEAEEAEEDDSKPF